MQSRRPQGRRDPRGRPTLMIGINYNRKLKMVLYTLDTKIRNFFENGSEAICLFVYSLNHLRVITPNDRRSEKLKHINNKQASKKKEK